MLIAGIDDAGRGPIVGPLVIAGVLFDERDLSRLTALKVKDSKLLSPRRRNHLAPEIRKVALKCHIVKFSPSEIDEIVNLGKKLRKLNWLEASGMAEVILRLEPNVAYVDASDVKPERFKAQILETIPFNVKVISEHKADRTYPVVSAASIIAKVERDAAVAELRNEYGDLGSGYVSDDKTMNFLANWMRQHGSLPDCVRRSWKPVKDLMDAQSFHR